MSRAAPKKNKKSRLLGVIVRLVLLVALLVVGLVLDVRRELATPLAIESPTLFEIAPGSTLDETRSTVEQVLAEAPSDAIRARIEKRLKKAGFKVEVVPTRAYPQAKRKTHTVFVATRPGKAAVA